MARWEPNTEQRLRDAAMELFTERSFEAVTITQIAERAGVTRRSFFRYFPDKKEVLFGGSERLAPEIERRLHKVPGGESMHNAIIRVLTDAGDMLVSGNRATQRRRRSIITDSPELREREQSKNTDIAGAIARVLAARGEKEADAYLVGAVFTAAFSSAYSAALDHEGTPFEDTLSMALTAIRTALRVT